MAACAASSASIMATEPARLILVFGAAVVLGAVRAPAVGAAAVEPPVPAFSGPEVVKLDWNTRGLVAADLDGDGRTDLALVNNDRARIEMLLQRAPGDPARSKTRRVESNRWEPELEDARFEKRPLTTGIAVFDLAVGDLDGDGRADLAYTGDPDTLTVRLQSAAGDWNEKRVLDLGKPSQYLTVLRIHDLDGDGRADLVALLQKELVVLRQDAQGRLQPPERCALADENCYSLFLADVDGDRRPDAVYLASGRRDALRVRLQQPGGVLGPEMPLRIEAPRTTLQVVDTPEGRPGFAYVQHPTAMLTVAALRAGGGTGGDPLAALEPRVFSTRAGAKNPPACAFGDVDGDGRADLVLSDPDGAQLLVYFQAATGELGEARSYPSLAEGRSVAAADWDGDGRAEVFVASPKEQTLGLARWTPEGRLGYPQPVAVTGKPLAVDAGSMAPGQPPAVAVALEEGGKRRVDIVANDEGGPAVVGSIELAGLRTDPKAIRLADADQDGRLDMAVFVPFEPMRLIVQNTEGAWTDLSTVPGYRRGLVENLEASALSLADVDGDGRREMLVAGSGFARALRLGADGVLEVADQFNAREAGTDIGAALAVDVDGDGRREVVLLDRKNEQLQVLRRDAQGVFAYADAVPASRIDLVGAVQTDLDRDGHEDLFFFGRDRFWAISTGGAHLRPETVITHETDLKDVTYADVACGDVDGDGRRDFVMVDVQQHLLEVLVRRGGEVRSVLHFRVFEADPHVQRRGAQGSEPRETLVADVTGDGRDDLVLLVHDRVLVYPAE
jgi:hypothetical protein